MVGMARHQHANTRVKKNGTRPGLQSAWLQSVIQRKGHNIKILQHHIFCRLATRDLERSLYYLVIYGLREVQKMLPLGYTEWQVFVTTF